MIRELKEKLRRSNVTLDMRHREDEKTIDEEKELKDWEEDRRIMEKAKIPLESKFEYKVQQLIRGKMVLAYMEGAIRIGKIMEIFLTDDPLAPWVRIHMYGSEERHHLMEKRRFKPMWVRSNGIETLVRKSTHKEVKVDIDKKDILYIFVKKFDLGKMHQADWQEIVKAWGRVAISTE